MYVAFHCSENWSNVSIWKCKITSLPFYKNLIFNRIKYLTPNKKCVKLLRVEQNFEKWINFVMNMNFIYMKLYKKTNSFKALYVSKEDVRHLRWPSLEQKISKYTLNNDRSFHSRKTLALSAKLCANNMLLHFEW